MDENKKNIIVAEPAMEESKKFEVEKNYIYKGDELKIEEISKIMRNLPTRIIILAGPAESGKTTLLTSIYNFFQKMNFKDYLFMGSQTLPGFEERSFLSRYESGNTFEDTARTNPQYESFLHLDIVIIKEMMKKISLLLSDLSGEKFRRMRDSTEACKEYSILKRADHFNLVFDCKELVKPTGKYIAKEYGLSLLRSLIEANMITKENIVNILFTKWDFISCLPNKQSNLDFISDIESEIREKYCDQVNRIESFKLACRPINDKTLGVGFGLKEVFSFWVNESPYIYKFHEENISKIISDREFRNFK